jgi:hypothetical protein
VSCMGESSTLLAVSWMLWNWMHEGWRVPGRQLYLPSIVAFECGVDSGDIGTWAELIEQRELCRVESRKLFVKLDAMSCRYEAEFGTPLARFLIPSWTRWPLSTTVLSILVHAQAALTKHCIRVLFDWNEQKESCHPERMGRRRLGGSG